MKLIAKPIDVIAWFDTKGIPHPIRLRVSNINEKYEVINIDRIITQNKERFAGNEMILFKCQSIINSKEILYELKFELETCKWMLYKI